MKAKIYQTGPEAFDIVNGAGVLFSTFKTSSGWFVREVGPVGPAFKPSGRLVRGLPPFLRKLFFTVQKNRHNDNF